MEGVWRSRSHFFCTSVDTHISREHERPMVGAIIVACALCVCRTARERKTPGHSASHRTSEWLFSSTRKPAPRDTYALMQATTVCISRSECAPANVFHEGDICQERRWRIRNAIRCLRENGSGKVRQE